MPAIRKVLLPVAFSDRCRGAAFCAAAVAGHVHAETTIFHCLGIGDFLRPWDRNRAIARRMACRPARHYEEGTRPVLLE